MRRSLTQMSMTLASLTLCLTLAGCVTIGPKAERETIWAKKGTIGKVVSDSTVEILVPLEGSNNEWIRTKADAKGMILIDEETYQAMLECYRLADDKVTAACGELLPPPK
ncbi:MAG: hypothetical protein GY851_03390 [bacterium]|nr:hypothetical protein [bacterium]